MVENSVILPYYHQVDATRIRNLIANGANSMKKCYTYSRSLLKNFLQMLSFVFGFISTVCDARIISVHRTASWSSMNRSLYCKNTREFHFKSNQNGNNEPFQLRLHTYLIPFHKNTRAIGTSPSSSWSELSENECKCFDEIFKLFFFHLFDRISYRSLILLKSSNFTCWHQIPKEMCWVLTVCFN